MSLTLSPHPPPPLSLAYSLNSIVLIRLFRATSQPFKLFFLGIYLLCRPSLYIIVTWLTTIITRLSMVELIAYFMMYMQARRNRGRGSLFKASGNVAASSEDRSEFVLPKVSFLVSQYYALKMHQNWI